MTSSSSRPPSTLGARAEALPRAAGRGGAAGGRLVGQEVRRGDRDRVAAGGVEADRVADQGLDLAAVGGVQRVAVDRDGDGQALHRRRRRPARW